jgi:hypothetical protein
VVSDVVNSTCIRFLSPIWQPDPSNGNGLAAIGNGYDLVDLIVELDSNPEVHSAHLPFKFHGMYEIKSSSLTYMSPRGKSVVYFTVSEGDIYSDLTYEVQFSLLDVNVMTSASVTFINEKTFAVEIPPIDKFFTDTSAEYIEDSFYCVSARLTSATLTYLPKCISTIFLMYN